MGWSYRIQRIYNSDITKFMLQQCTLSQGFYNLCVYHSVIKCKQFELIFMVINDANDCCFKQMQSFLYIINQKEMQISSLLSSITKQLICGLVFIVAISFLFIKLIWFITGSHLLGFLIIVYGLYRLLRLVGTFALYPASFKYLKADYEIRGSRVMGEQILVRNQELLDFLRTVQQHPSNIYFAGIAYSRHVTDTIKMLGMFRGSLNEKKRELLQAYEAINTVLKTEIKISDNITTTYQDFLSNPRDLGNAIQSQFNSSTQLCKLATELRQSIFPSVQSIHLILHFFHPPHQLSGLIQSFLYRINNEKLFQLRFSYIYWESKFQYSLHQIETSDSDAVIQCAVIKGLKGQPLQTNKCVIISNPNGAYLQYFALQSQYVGMYIDLGYQIVLWNYRGYGQSTGSPSISTSISDAQDVYNYSKRILKLDPQVAHGYSIGGPTSAVLALTNPLKVLVVDRSFCNFVNIAHEISPVLAYLAKIVMKSDSDVNISDVYLRTMGCRKILIWSAVDEVISNGSSLKQGILNRLLNEAELRQQIRQNLHHNSPTALITDNELNQRQLFIQKGQKSSRTQKTHHKRKYKNWLQKILKFFNTMSSIYEIQKSELFPQTMVTKQNSPNNSLVQQIPSEAEMKQKQTSVQKKQMVMSLMKDFWDAVGGLDGGGTTMKLLRELTQVGLAKQEQLELEVKSFVLGLLFYGCCFHQNGQINVDNLDNWPQTKSMLNKTLSNLDRLTSESGVKNKQLSQIIRQFKQVLKQIKQHIDTTKHNEDRSLGIILPTDSGHNGELTNTQMQYLKLAIGLKKESKTFADKNDKKWQNQQKYQQERGGMREERETVFE